MAGAFGVSRWLRSPLYGIGPNDWMAYAGAAVLLALAHPGYRVTCQRAAPCASILRWRCGRTEALIPSARSAARADPRQSQKEGEMRRCDVIAGLWLVVVLFVPAGRPAAAARAGLVFATFAETPQQLQNVAYFVESVRTFAGAMKDARFLVYAPAPLLAGEPVLLRRLEALRAEARPGTAPEDALAFPFARKVFAAALAGAILSQLARQEMVELDLRYNFPLFFKEMFGAEREFDSIADVVTLRHESYFRNPAPDWEKKLKGPPEKVKWFTDRFIRK